MNGWMDGYISNKTNDTINVVDYLHNGIYRWKDGSIDGQTNGLMDGWEIETASELISTDTSVTLSSKD